MKRIISLALVLILTLSCTVLMFSCKKESILGVYEMTEISGKVTSNGVTVELEEGLYEYYTLELKEDGKGTVKSSGAGTNQELRQDIEWEYDEETGALDIISKVDGQTVVEKMTLKDGKITYSTSTTGSFSGVTMTISMELVLEKKADN